MHDYLTRFGLGTATGIDILGERPGVVPSREWKRKNFRDRDNQRWYHGETVIASIGQGFMLTTPLQLAVAAGTLATHGMHYRPHLVAAIEDPLTGERKALDREPPVEVDIDNAHYWDQILGAMHDVMQGTRGTARAVGIGAPYTMAGKSGTAQVVSIAQDEKYDEQELEETTTRSRTVHRFRAVRKPADSRRRHRRKWRKRQRRRGTDSEGRHGSIPRIR